MFLYEERTDLVLLKRLLDLLQVGQQADVRADLQADAQSRDWPQDGSISKVSPASAAHLVNSRAQTGQAGQTVDVHLTAVRLSGHQVGPVTLRIKASKLTTN